MSNLRASSPLALGLTVGVLAALGGSTTAELDLRTDLRQSSTPLLAQMGQTLEELRACDLWLLGTYHRHGLLPEVSRRLGEAAAQLGQVTEAVRALPIGETAKRDTLEALNACQSNIRLAGSARQRAQALTEAAQRLITAEEHLRPFHEGRRAESVSRVLNALSGSGGSVRTAINDVRGDLDFEDLGPRERLELLERLTKVEHLLAHADAHAKALDATHTSAPLSEDGTKAFLAALHARLAARRSALIARAKASRLRQGLMRRLGNALTFRAFEDAQHAQLLALIAKVTSWERQLNAELAAAQAHRQVLALSQDALHRLNAALDDAQGKTVETNYAAVCPSGFFEDARNRAFVAVLDDRRVERFVRVNIEELESSLKQLERRLAGRN